MKANRNQYFQTGIGFLSIRFLSVIVLFSMCGVIPVIAQEGGGNQSENNGWDQIWSVETRGSVYSQPVVKNDRVFAGTSGGSVYAFDAKSGEELWQIVTKGEYQTSPAVANGRVFVGSSNHHLYAINAKSGDIIWSFETGDGVISNPAVVKKRVFFGSKDGNLYALDTKSGEKVWSFETGNEGYSAPAVSGGRVFAKKGADELVSLNAKSGKKLWSFQADSEIYSPPVASGNYVYVGEEKRLYALKAATGEVVWTFQGKKELNFPPVATASTLFVTTESKSVYVLNALTGKSIRELSTDFNILSSPVLIEGRLYFTTMNDDEERVHVYNLQTGVETRIPVPLRAYDPPVIVEGRMFLGLGEQLNGRIHAIKTDVGSSMSSWSMDSKNPGRTGTTMIPGIPDEMKKNLKAFQSALKNEDRKKKKQILDSWKRKHHPIVQFCRGISRIQLHLKNGKVEKAIEVWNKRVKPASFSNPETVGSFVRILHKNSSLKKYIQKQTNRLKKRSLKERKAATRTLQKAGILGLPVLTERRDMDNAEARKRIRDLLKRLRVLWPMFFEDK